MFGDIARSQGICTEPEEREAERTRKTDNVIPEKLFTKFQKWHRLNSSRCTTVMQKKKTKPEVFRIHKHDLTINTPVKELLSNKEVLTLGFKV